MIKNKIRRRHQILQILPVIVTFLIFFFDAGCKFHRPLPSYTVCDVSYGSDREHSIDVSLPEGRTAATPAIILIHGGAWTGGDKSDFSFLREHFCKRGFASFSVNYRLARTRGAGIRNIVLDIDKALAFIKGKSDYWTFSGSSIFILGYSAGGHIALLYTFSRSQEKTIRGVISLSGMSDLTDPELEKFLTRMQKREAPHERRVFDRLRFVAGPTREMRQANSPLFNIRDVPTLLICGKRDEIIPWSQSEILHRIMKERGYDSTLYTYPDMGHDITDYYGEIMKITERWMLDRK